MPELSQQKKELVKNFIAELTAVSPEKLDLEQRLVGSGALDSIKIAQVVIFISDEFSIDLLRSDLSPENFESLSRIFGLIESNLV